MFFCKYIHSDHLCYIYLASFISSASIRVIQILHVSPHLPDAAFLKINRTLQFFINCPCLPLLKRYRKKQAMTGFKSRRFDSILSIELTQSKSKTIITRSMLTISLIVFTDKFQGHVHTFYSKWYFITS